MNTIDISILGLLKNSNGLIFNFLLCFLNNLAQGFLFTFSKNLALHV
jgi:hypothetical protein